MSQNSLKQPNEIDVTIALTPFNLEQFDQAKFYIEKIYGKSPPVENLIHLCLCKPSWEIVQAFTTAVKEISESNALADLGDDPILSL